MRGLHEIILLCSRSDVSKQGDRVMPYSREVTVVDGHHCQQVELLIWNILQLQALGSHLHERGRLYHLIYIINFDIDISDQALEGACSPLQ